MRKNMFLMGGFLVEISHEKEVQSNGYETHTVYEYGNGRYCHVQGGDNLSCFENDDLIGIVFGHIHMPEYISKDNAEKKFQIEKWIFDYKKSLTKFLCSLNGTFCAIVLDKKNEELTLISDKLGFYRIHYHIDSQKQHLLFSNSPNPIIPSIEGEGTSLIGLRESLEYRWLSGTHTLIDKVRMVPYSCYQKLYRNNELSEPMRYWMLPRPIVNRSRTQEQAVHEVEGMLVKQLQEQAKIYKRVAVPLSGGVDSSLLAAIAKDCFERCIAVTPVFANKDSQELETAKEFARLLDIEHVLVPIDNDQVTESLSRITKLLWQPIRNQSIVAMDMLFHQAKLLDCECVISGESADTLYGYKVAGWYKNRSLRVRQVTILKKWLDRVGVKLPAKFQTLLRESEVERIQSWQLLENTSSGQKFIDGLCKGSTNGFEVSKFIEEEFLKSDNVDSDELIYRQKTYLISTFIANHLNDLGALSAHHNIPLLAPFLLDAPIQYAQTLSQDLYLGKKHIKPVLKEIAARRFDPSLIYIEKKGFPTPYKEWVDGALVEKRSKVLDYVSSNFNLKIDDDYELQWTLMGLFALGILPMK